MLPIVHTALAAVAAWLVAGLVVSESRPTFAAIAAVVTVGATFGQRGERTIQLTAGIVLGIVAADVMIRVIGVGPAQLGLLIVLAMLAAVLLGGGEMVVCEAAVTAILLVTVGPAVATDRILEAVIGGAAALVVGLVVFPPDPALAPGRAGQSLFAALGGTLERVAQALDHRDPQAAETALDDARAIDPLVADVQETLQASREAARLDPRPDARKQLERYGRSIGQLDFAVRNTRVLARSALRLVRAGEAPHGLDDAVRELGDAVWELAGAYDDPRRADQAARLAAEAAAHAAETPHPELAGTVRSTAADLMRAAALIADSPAEQPTEELLAVEL
jgi:hypothetical protein